ncbi:spondin domain-containing protein [Stieleria sp. JC731]|uniref:spondin domain-containing protein n=1 Tax=Pirellulaceae TaxID=2691357 RepID=UPI001E4A42E4|nr:spondin domain-containing protein [Stieleria sp. JC731]MCC9602158.1 spondin domain-containing protein [Stieleria sp. JC731]
MKRSQWKNRSAKWFKRQPFAPSLLPGKRAKGKRSCKHPLTIEAMERREMLAAETLRITIENLSDAGGISETPFWVAAHDGGFQVAEIGQPASNFGGLETIAEEGNPAALASRFAGETTGVDTVITAPDGFAGAPVFEPNEVASGTLMVSDPMTQRYFSYASMVIPSNDAFIANLDPDSIELFDLAGNFTGARSIVVYGRDILDAGTEVNDPLGGAAFSTGGGSGVDENSVVMTHVGLDDFVGTGLPTGDDLGKAFSANTPIARITIALDSDPQGAFDQHGPMVAFDASTLEARSSFHEVRVTYSDPSGVDLTSLSVDDIRVVGPSLASLDVVSVEVDALPGTTPHEVTATYRIASPGSSFESIDNGIYSVVLQANAVNDPLGHDADARLLGHFEVDIPMSINIAFENLSDTFGLANTPIWFAAHEGNFRIGLASTSASGFAGLETLAETGAVSELDIRFTSESNGVSNVLLAPDGFPGAPVFEPGEISTAALEISNPLAQRYFSFASMIIPSNDAFVANLDPRMIELFDAFGNFKGTQTITIYGNNIWDAGTEVNDPNSGAAFSTLGGSGLDEHGVIHRHTGLDEFVGTGLPTGDDLGAAFDALTPIGRFTISMEGQSTIPIDFDGPAAALHVEDLQTSGESVHEVQVVYNDPSGIDVDSIDIHDLEILGTVAGDLEVVGVTTDAIEGDTNHSVVATYEIRTTHGGPISAHDNGLYFISLRGNQVNDAFGNASQTQALGSFEVYLPVALEISVENLQPSGGLLQTPFWIGVHDGSFQIAAAGQDAASFPGLETIAEEGDPSELAMRFASESNGASTVVTAPSGFPGAPVFEPGESDHASLSVFNTNENRFLSFASMIIPSNDAFVANLNPRSIELFDQQGFFLGQKTITIYGRDIWDAGTEENDPDSGAAFTTAGGTGMEESGVIHRHRGLSDFIGAELPSQTDLDSSFAPATPIARITIGLAGSTQLPIDLSGPTAEVHANDVTVAGTQLHHVEVTYRDPSGIDLSSIDEDDIRILGPLNQTLEVHGFEIDPAAQSGDTTVTVSYAVAPASDPFTARDNGTYFVTAVSDEVVDTLGQGVMGYPIGEFDVQVGVRLQVTVESLTASDGLYLTPFWVGLHDGGFEVARGGLNAADFPGLESIAEEGDPGELAVRFANETDGSGSVVFAPGGFAGAPVFDPGESVSQIVEVHQSFANRYFSFASMVIPSNDAFVGNRNSRQYELFDAQGNFRGAKQITIHGRDILDAGTEANDPSGGAAFSTGGGIGLETNDPIQRHSGLDDFIGTGLPTGELLGHAFSSTTPIARITISLFDPQADVCSGVLAACSVRSVSLQNATLTADVNRDGAVSPLDALLVINFLARFGTTETIADEAQATGLALDVEGDELVSIIDALVVINEIGRRLAVSDGEGESIEAFDIAVTELSSNDIVLGSERDDVFVESDELSMLF